MKTPDELGLIPGDIIVLLIAIFVVMALTWYQHCKSRREFAMFDERFQRIEAERAQRHADVARKNADLDRLNANRQKARARRTRMISDDEHLQRDLAQQIADAPHAKYSLN